MSQENNQSTVFSLIFRVQMAVKMKVHKIFSNFFKGQILDAKVNTKYTVSLNFHALTIELCLMTCLMKCQLEF